MLLHEAWDWSLRRVVAEHLVEEMGMQVIEGLLSSPDLALVMVGSRDLEHVLGLTRAFIGSSPIVAVMARTDLDLARRALCGGAAACYALDTPLASLEAAVRDVLVPAATSVGEG